MLEHLSFSSISRYLTCARDWKFHYIEHAPALTSANLVFGSAVHNTVEAYVQIGSEIGELWQAAWDDQMNENKGFVDWGDNTPESMFNQGLCMMKHADILSLLDTLHPLSHEWIERKVELRVPGVPLPVIGYIDIVTQDGIPGDFKTSARSWTADKAADEMQPLFYLAALNQSGYTQNPEWLFRHYVFVKTKEPKVQVFEHRHEPQQLFWMFEMIKSVWDAIEAGVYPLNPTGWKCSPQYCDYWSQCRGRKSGS